MPTPTVFKRRAPRFRTGPAGRVARDALARVRCRYACIGGGAN